MAHWLRELAGELAERIEADRAEHERLPTALTLNLQGGGGGDASHSRAGRLTRVSAEAICEEATALARKWAAERWVCRCVGRVWDVCVGVYVCVGATPPCPRHSTVHEPKNISPKTLRVCVCVCVCVCL